MLDRMTLRTASIPSKNRGRSAGTEMGGSLVVRKLQGMTSPENSFMTSSSDVTSSLNGLLISNNDSTSRLKSDLKQKLRNVECDQRSLEILVRLLKSGNFTRDVNNTENQQPPSSPARSPDRDDLTLRESPTYVSDYIIGHPSRSYSSRAHKSRPVTSDPSPRFRQSIEELKNTRERFGVCMSVNGVIAKARNIQQKNERSRRNAARAKLPVLNGSPSSECVEREKQSTTPRHSVISPLGPWLALSGRKIQLKHQGHVERALGQPEHLFIRPERDVITRQRRYIRSAPPKASIRKPARSDGNRFVMNKVFYNTKSSVNFSASYHGLESPRRQTEEDEKAIQCDDTVDTKDHHDVTIDTPPARPSSSQSSESISRPSSSSMPRPVRSVIIKRSLRNITSSTMVLAQSTNTFPRRSSIQL